MTRVNGERHVPSGWYPDPDTAEAMRWWDGKHWTPVTRPSNSPTDPRGKRLLLAGYVLLTAGIVANYITLPWVVSEPIPGHVDPDPLWITVLIPAALGAIGLGIACFLAHWIVRRRKKNGRPHADDHQSGSTPAYE